MKSKANWTKFSKIDSSNDYLTLILRKDSSQAKLVLSTNATNSDLWQGEVSTLQKAIKDNAKLLKMYTKYCPTFMPAYLYRGNFCIHYNADLIIISKDQPRYID